MTNDHDRGQAAEDILAVRALRKRLFPSDIFDEHAWSMLLVLFIGIANGETIIEKTLLDRAGVSESAGHRWISHLVEEEQIEPRRNDDIIILSETALNHLRTFLDYACDVARQAISRQAP